MASTRPADEEPAVSPPPSKRARLSPSSEQLPVNDSAANGRIFSADADVGITEYLSKDVPGFSGKIKQRYTDFLVNEIDLDGNILRLKQLSVPKSLESAKKPADDAATANKPNRSTADVNTEPKSTEVSASKEPEESLDEKLAPLRAFLPDTTIGSMVSLYREAVHHRNKLGSKYPTTRVETDAIDSKDDRSKIHQQIRSIFDGKLSTQTSSDSKIEVWATRGGHNRREQGPRHPQSSTKKSWDELGGSYLHFNLYKENKDTMNCITILAKFLRVPPKAFTFAGTKDRRAVTVQRVAVNKVRAEDLAKLNPTLRGFKVGDYEYKPKALPLGELSGNEFCITIRDCDLGESGAPGLELAMKSLRDKGYINYYGLQRFGTYRTGTHSVGVSVLNADWEKAIEKIMANDPEVKENTLPDERDRTKACQIWAGSNPTRIAAAREASKVMPRKFVAENAVLKFFSRQDSRNNWLGAIQQIPRNLRLMYVHAYQSYVWNTVASERIRRHGMEVLPGDVVLLSAEEAAAKRVPDVNIQDGGDDDDEVNGVEEGFLEEYESRFQDARPISEEEAKGKKFTIYDVVLPTPGWAMVYPENDIKQVYVDVMAKDNLDPFNMKRNQQETSLSGNYRKLVYRPENVEWDLKRYTNPNEQFVDTDLVGSKREEEAKLESVDATESEPTRTAVVVKLKLGTSQYATMALREASKGQVSQYATLDPKKKEEI